MAFGACSLVAYDDRDYEAANAMYELPSRAIEDNQLVHFGLLLLTRVDPDGRQGVRQAIKAIASPNQTRRDAGRSRLGSLLAKSLEADREPTSPRPTRTSAPVLPATDHRSTVGALAVVLLVVVAVVVLLVGGVP